MMMVMLVLKTLGKNATILVSRIIQQLLIYAVKEHFTVGDVRNILDSHTLKILTSVCLYFAVFDKQTKT